jgi:hypothetical protein
MVGMLCHVQHLWVAAEPKARKIHYMGRLVVGKPGRYWRQIAVGHRQSMQQHQPRSDVGAVERGTVVDGDSLDDPPAALEPPGRLWCAGGELIPAQGRPKSSTRLMLLAAGSPPNPCPVLSVALRPKELVDCLGEAFRALDLGRVAAPGELDKLARSQSAVDRRPWVTGMTRWTDTGTDTTVGSPALGALRGPVTSVVSPG